MQRKYDIRMEAKTVKKALAVLLILVGLGYGGIVMGETTDIILLDGIDLFLVMNGIVSLVFLLGGVLRWLVGNLFDSEDKHVD